MSEECLCCGGEVIGDGTEDRDFSGFCSSECQHEYNHEGQVPAPVGDTDPSDWI